MQHNLYGNVVDDGPQAIMRIMRLFWLRRIEDYSNRFLPNVENFRVTAFSSIKHLLICFRNVVRHLHCQLLDYALFIFIL